MADYIVTSGELTTVANAIRAKNGTSSSLSWPNGFVSGISSGGGGSSDFSTAVVTVNGNGGFAAEVASLTTNGLSGTCFKSPFVDSFTVVLYQGKTIMQGISATPTFSIPESETNIIYDEDNGWYLITGDCTITIS